MTDTPPKPRAGSLGSAVARGSAWMIGGALFTRFGSFVAQILLGRLLSEEDFGVYALAISISTLAALLRDGGTRQLLVQRSGEWEVLSGPIFWFAMAFNLLTAALLAAAAPLAAQVYHEPKLVTMLLIIAVCQPMSTPGSVLQARLTCDLRFDALTVINSVSALWRFGGSVALAYLGFGPLAFVLPLPVIALSEWFLGLCYTRPTLWRRSPRTGTWLTIIKQTKWLMIGTLGIALFNQGTSTVIGLQVSKEVVGVYFFAFQIVVQLGMLLASNINNVLFPAFAQLADDPDRKRAAVLRSATQLMLIAAPMSTGLAATFPPIEDLIWHNKWDAAVLPVQIIGLLYPFTIMTAVSLAVQQARGHFGAWALGLIALAVATLGSAALGAAIHPSAVSIATATSIAGAIGGITHLLVVARSLQITPMQTARAALAPWAMAVAAGLACVLVENRLEHVTGPIPRLIAIGVVFGLIFVPLARLFMATQLAELLRIVPARLREPARRVLLLPAAQA